MIQVPARHENPKIARVRLKRVHSSDRETLTSKIEDREHYRMKKTACKRNREQPPREKPSNTRHDAALTLGPFSIRQLRKLRVYVSSSLL